MDHHQTGKPRRVRALRADGVEFEIETEEYFTLGGNWNVFSIILRGWKKVKVYFLEKMEL